jgi:hypothetical protein
LREQSDCTNRYASCIKPRTIRYSTSGNGND